MIGQTIWAIAEAYIPYDSVDPSDAAPVSHETGCILNAGVHDATVEITLNFENRPPTGPYCIAVAAQRTLHQRFNDLEDAEPVPRVTDYAGVIQSNRPIVVQHTRLDPGRAEILLHDGLGRLVPDSSPAAAPA